MTGSNEHAKGTLCFIYELLTHFAGNWSAVPQLAAAQQGGIEDGIICTMRAYPIFATVQERGCVALGRLAIRNVARFNPSSIITISTTLKAPCSTTFRTVSTCW